MHILTLQWRSMPTALPAVTMDVTVTVAMGSAAAQVALRGHAVVHSAGRRQTETQRGREAGTDTRAQRQRVCIQSIALPNLERLVLRSPTQDRMFTPWFFGQDGDQSMLCGAGDCSLDLKRAAVMDGEHGV